MYPRDGGIVSADFLKIHGQNLLLDIPVFCDILSRQPHQLVSPGTMALYLGKILRANLTHRYNLWRGLEPKVEIVHVIHCRLERPVTLEGKYLPGLHRFQYNTVRFCSGNLKLIKRPP